jgi:CheY-like chemotaxis protein
MTLSDQPASTGVRVLVLEDEAVIGMLIEDMLLALGHVLFDLAPSVERALQAMETELPDFAILDVNLHGTRSYPVADVLLERKIPFVFLSGYGAPGIDAPYTHIKTLQKPFRPQDLAKAIAGGCLEHAAK